MSTSVDHHNQQQHQHHHSAITPQVLCMYTLTCVHPRLHSMTAPTVWHPSALLHALAQCDPTPPAGATSCT
ncbi:hypothetical protein SCLCIDRAFT_29619 [Scleroderma citrinum Foug A]|uniref:Uncharacterized protein n=1 Tax=Scleroderma citrinum Foug A TaxID=1036808 RepID=A0A0C3D6S9_9AGAM|nr:hypothetical protein SCLCIDRAFT_29619 [Scleroderma citrinum Foug A]